MGTHSRYQQRSPARIPIRAESRSARREGRGKLKVHLYKAVLDTMETEPVLRLACPGKHVFHTEMSLTCFFLKCLKFV